MWRKRTALYESFWLFAQAFTQMDYAIEFRTTLNNVALINAFLGGLSARIKEQLISFDLPNDLDSAIAVANKIDRRLHNHDRERADPCHRQPPVRQSYLRVRCCQHRGHLLPTTPP